MIVAMQKIYVVVPRDQKDRLLTGLRELGAVHLVPVDPQHAQADEATVTALNRLGRAEQVLSGVSPAGQAPELSPLEAADAAMEAWGQLSSLDSRLTALAREAEALELWGDVRLEQFRQLQADGVDVRVYDLPADRVDAVQGQAVWTVGESGRDQVRVAVATYVGQEPRVPEEAEPVEWPRRDRPTVRAEAQRVQAAIDQQRQILAALAHRRADIRAEHQRAQRRAEWMVAERGGVFGEDLFGVQGWLPKPEVDALREGLAGRELTFAVELLEPASEELPPTLIRYPAWARPIKGLFDILGTVPGYREGDVSGFFMIALPIFAAMLIGDAGYGLLFTLVPLLFYRKLRASLGAAGTHLVMVFGVVTVVWGMMTGIYFGVSPSEAAQYGGYESVEAMVATGEGTWASLGQAMVAVAPLYRTDGEAARDIVMMISFVLGAMHLISAQLRQAVALAPHPLFVANVGWAGFLAGMLGVVWMLFFPDRIWMPTPVMAGLLIVGGLLVVLFSFPGLSAPKRVGLGVLANLLPMIGTFSDMMSYIRLMAVGMASFYIAFAFNLLSGQLAEAASWLVGGPVLVLGHGLNIALVMIAIFAHGVRLNMLEFSNNAGVQWSGYAYAPFGGTE